MRVLFLGGTAWLGHTLAGVALRAGHEVGASPAVMPCPRVRHSCRPTATTPVPLPR